MDARKRALRRTLLAQRKAVPTDVRTARDALIASHLLRFPALCAARAVFSYVGHDWEVATMPLLRALQARGVAVSIPLCLSDGQMEPRLLGTDAHALRAGAFGLPEPDPDKCPPFPAGAVELVLTPALAFDRAGFRIGRGGGFYDRFLARGVSSIGLCYTEFVLDMLPRAPFDRAVTHLITEDGALF